MWKNMVKTRESTDYNVIWNMRYACWIIKDRDTHSEYEINYYFLRQQWLREYFSMVLYTYFACPVRTCL